ncbi:MAG: ribonuclease Y [Candidatus Sungbacteria bacterium RIFCSPLOWO2_01_FULL_47_10]|uniref:Ribonuclease Y n=1 Tax=Candidatus Sungbacteria bacterium RIFCSPLOWO2_01_FULL_47_10 TaxID=1802276 RepID=A0A1G2L2M9_9BACT|nr:MAG: ribonuclease Y [Candidatus Sungbacteria bacterium RIFCSPLOWO2_01_FULL_47_10]
MNLSIAAIFGALFLVVAAGAGGYFLRQLIVQQRKNSIEARLKKLIEDSRAEAKEILLDAKDKAVKTLEEAKNEERARIVELKRTEDRIVRREETLDKKISGLEEKERELQEKIERVKSIKQEIELLKEKAIAELERVSGLSGEAAKEELFKKIEKQYGDDLAKHMRKLEEAGMDELEQKAKNILTTVIQRLASSTASEVTTTTVAIPSDDLKGKIIGREGRNIRALERAAGVEIIVDDTPGAIVISGFDPVRRHIAKNALENLILDGRIQPARIEEAVDKARESIEKQVREAGEAAAFEIGCFDLDPRLLNLLGRLKFRTSYGQNVLMHSVEMAHMAAMLATELGADIQIAKKGALLHDIGKAVDHEIQGTHVEIGRRILEKFNVDKRLIQAMQSHHEEYPYETIESVIVQTVDAISASRPGARRDSVENYLKRLQDLENIANSFEGVEKSYAIQAGREIRIFVAPDKISDLEAKQLARNIAERVQNELKYPGEIKVHLIRELRVVEYAK